MVTKKAGYLRDQGETKERPRRDQGETKERPRRDQGVAKIRLRVVLVEIDKFVNR
jgi:hypothetical protein